MSMAELESTVDGLISISEQHVSILREILNFLKALDRRVRELEARVA